MKIFLSWSGEVSHKAALIMQEWLSSVLPALEPFVSSEDIAKGQRWNVSISKELEACSYGILFVTRENQNAPWLVFEAGALSKAFEDSRVVPFLLNLSPSDLKGPISHFQCVQFDKEDVFKLLHSIVQLLPDRRPGETRLRKMFDVWWPQLDQEMKSNIEEGQPISIDNKLLLQPSVPWIPLVLQGDPQHSSYAIGDCVVFDQSELGTSYRYENIKVKVSDRNYELPNELKDIAEKYKPQQIGKNLPHYIIDFFKHSEIDFPEVELTLSRCWYMDIRSVQAAIQDNPNQIIDVAGSTLINKLVALAPLNLKENIVPSQISVNVVLMIFNRHEEPHLLITQRGPAHQVGYYPEAWSVSMQETMSAGGDIHAEIADQGDNTLYECAVRGIKEEILGETIPERSVEFQCFFLEANVLNQSSIAIAKLDMSFKELCDKRRYLADDNRESGFVCAVPCRSEILTTLINQEHFDLDYVLRFGKSDAGAAPAPLNKTRTWHPSARLALFMVLRRYYPKEARSWLLRQLGHLS